MATEKKISDVELLNSMSNDVNLIAEQNGKWKRLNGNILNNNNIFIAEYDVTTPDELVKAYREGKEIILKVDEHGHYCDGRISYIDGLAALNDAENHPKPACVIHFIATTRDDNIAGERGYRCSCNYSSTSSGIEIGWAKENTKLLNTINRHETDITNLKQQVNNISKIITSFKAESLSANSKFKITKTGLYLFAGADYNLKIRGANDSNVGSHDNNLLITLFVSHVGTQGSGGNYHAFVGKTYKSTLTTSAESKNIYWEDTLSEDLCPYVENTDDVNSAMVYYLTQNN